MCYNKTISKQILGWVFEPFTSNKDNTFTQVEVITVGETFLWVEVITVGETFTQVEVITVGETFTQVEVITVGETFLQVEVITVGETFLWVEVITVGETFLWVEVITVGETFLWVEVITVHSPRYQRPGKMLKLPMISETCSPTVSDNIYLYTPHSIHNILRKICETGRTADRPRSGRPRVTTPAQDWYIRTSHLRDRFRMATTTARVTSGTHNPSVSAQTVRNRLREAGLRACRPVVRLVLTRHHRLVLTDECLLVVARTHPRNTHIKPHLQANSRLASVMAASIS
uniref:Transposase Tc1-like domain-containing protein n=1 Tax=Oncorhynchus tshawytscha TaxID=74940 RepID=A0AAZ3RYA6_ONCTS